MAALKITMTIPLEPLLNRSFGDTMRDSYLKPDGSIMLEYERLSPGIERGTRVGYWELVDE